MTFVQYYDRDLAGKLVPAIGDRGVLVLDGRNRLGTMMEDAVRYNGKRRPVYKAYSICKGTFTCFQFLTGVRPLN